MTTTSGASPRNPGDLRRLAGSLLQFRARLASAFVAALLAAAFFGGAISLLKPLTKAMVAGEAVATAAVETPARDADDAALPPEVQRARDWLQDVVRPAQDWVKRAPHLRVPVLIVLLYLLKAGLFFYADYTFRTVGLRATATLRTDLFTKTLGQSDLFFLRHSTGEMISRVLGDVGRLQSILGSDIGQMLQSIPTALVAITVAFWFSWQISLVCLLGIPLFAYAAGRIGQHAKKAARRGQEQAAILVGQIEETLLGRRVVQAYGAERHETERFAATIERNLAQERRVARATAATPAVMEIAGAFALVLLLIFASTMTRGGTLEPPNVLVTVVALGVLMTHVRRIGQLNTTLQQALAAARRVFEVLDEPVAVQDPPAPRRLPRFARAIRFEGVTFDYGRGMVLQGVDLALGAGEVHALVGPSGAGKSTLVMMVPRFIDPTAGCVTFDGTDLREVRLADLRSQIALVAQETHLFQGTVAENIAYGRPETDREAIESAARAAFAHAFIAALPQGYDTPLGERGTQLSAGQRQRIAIARAFLKDAPILILDEATSALDSASEREVQRALEALLAGRTALIIAHRLATVAHADRIHVLEAGRIIESGTHHELLARGGAYARLHRLQVT